MKKPTLTGNKKYRQGIFTPRNPEKFHNNGKGIVYRSGLELRYLNYFDMNPSILYVASEEFTIKYKSNIDLDSFGKPMTKTYYPDFIIKIKNRSGEIKIYMIEVKPLSQTKPPKKPKKKTKWYDSKLLEWQKNQDKWAAASAFCKKRNIEFTIMTEESIKTRAGK